MTRTRKPLRLALGCTIALGAGMIAIAGCAPSASVDSTPPDAQSQSVSTSAEAGPVFDLHQPIVKQLGDGTLIQRTPDEDISTTMDATAVLHHPTENVPSNTYFVKADARGCNACHEDLAKTIESMPYGHHSLSSDLGLEASVQQCLQCHRIGGSTVQTVPGEFGTLIHGIHSTGQAECWNCHDATNNGDAAGGQGEFDYSENIADSLDTASSAGSSMVLWDLTKHNKLRGITDIADTEVNGAFSYNTDELTDPEDLFNVTWQTFTDDYQRIAHMENNDPLDEELFNTWTVTVSGEVDSETTWTLPELIEQAPSEEFVAKLNCTVNPTNGPYVGQVECKGIPVSWLLEKAGVKDDAVNVSFCTPDGPYGNDTVEAINDESKLTYLVYEMGGERLTWGNGYPVIYIRPDIAAYADVKSVSELVVSSGAGAGYGSGFRFGLEYVKPTVGIYNLHEGQIIETGETHTFTGYVDAYNEEVVALEVSMDRGKSWKSFPIEGTDINRLITWSFDFTPENDSAYCLAVRGVTENGTKTEEYVEKMVVAKTETPAVYGSEVQ